MNAGLLRSVRNDKQMRGTITVPGDKSISHRALILGSIAEGVTHVRGCLLGDDNLATLGILRALGVTIEEKDTELLIHGVGLQGLKAPSQPLDCGNSGTAMRLLAGLLAAQKFDSELTGDASLLKRPMRRVVDPLMQMGASIQLSSEGTGPLLISGVASSLQGITYHMPIASAQVKSALLLAGLYAKGKTTIIEPAVTRDHTERMLKAMGAGDIYVPGDISSAAFFMVAAVIHRDADIILKDVGINPTRDAVIPILRQMGATIEVSNIRDWGHEPVADIRVRSSPLHGIYIPEALVSMAIDELPILMIAAAVAKGETILKGAAELRVKESDRIAAMAAGLSALGIQVEIYPDGMRVQGGELQGGCVDGVGDHRVAMSFAIAGSCAASPVIVTHCNTVNTSFPGFVDVARELGLSILVGFQ